MKNNNGSIVRPALVLFALLSAFTGLLYPAAVTGAAQALFPAQAAGSLVVRDGKPVGSALIGQNFSDPKHFWGRPSATAPQPDNASATGARRGAARGRPGQHRAGAGGPRHGLGQRARPRHQPRRCALPGCPCGA